MPAPAVYILAIVGTVAAGIAFKEFVYDPHIAPKVEEWKAKRKMRKAVKVAMKRGEPLHDVHDDASSVAGSSYEMREGGAGGTLRQRRNAGSPLNDSNASLPYTPLSPTPTTSTTHVLFDSSESSTRRSSPSPPPVTRFPLPQSGSQSPSVSSPPQSAQPLNPFADHSQGTSSQLSSSSLSFHSAMGASQQARSATVSPPPPSSFADSPSAVPSLSLSHPVNPMDLYHVDLVSPPSSPSVLTMSSPANSARTLENESDSDFDVLSSAGESDMSWVSADETRSSSR